MSSNVSFNYNARDVTQVQNPAWVECRSLLLLYTMVIRNFDFQDAREAERTSYLAHPKKYVVPVAGQSVAAQRHEGVKGRVFWCLTDLCCHG
jgi:hypothetical protein